jgi:Putative phage tail protein
MARESRTQSPPVNASQRGTSGRGGDILVLPPAPPEPTVRLDRGEPTENPWWGIQTPALGNGAVANAAQSATQPNGQARETTAGAVAGTILPVIYGTKQRVGGYLCQWDDSDSTYIYVVYAIGVGELVSIENITLGDLPISTWCGGSDYGVYLGTSSQSLDATLAAHLSDWVSSMPGQAYVWLRLNKTAASPQDLMSLKCDVKGRKVRDHRQDATLVTRYESDNGVLHRADWMTAEFGEALDDSEIDWGSVDTCADFQEDQLTALSTPASAPSGSDYGSGIDGGAGSTGYEYTYYDAAGNDSLASPQYLFTKLNSHYWNVTGVTTGPTGTVGRHVFRLSTSDGKWKYIKDLADNTTTAFLDTAIAKIDNRQPPGSSVQRFHCGFIFKMLTGWLQADQTFDLGTQTFRVYDGEKWKLIADTLRDPCGVSISDDDFIQPPTIRVKGQSEVFTQLDGSWTDPSNDYADAPVEAEAAAVTSGDAPPVKATYDLHMVQAYQEAYRHLVFLVNSFTLLDKELTLYVGPKAEQLLPGDRPSITWAAAGMSGDTSWQVKSVQNNGLTWTISLKRYDENVFTDAIVT